MQKRGISGVVATVLIILITVAAVAIIWMVIAPMLKTKTDAAVTSGGIELLIDTAHGYTTYNHSGHILCVQVKRGNDNLNLSGIQFSINFNGSSTTLTNYSVPAKNGEKRFCFNQTNVKPSSVSIAPIINKNGKDEVQPISSTVTGDQISEGSSGPAPQNVPTGPNNPCIDTCSSLGFQCGTQTVCGVSTDCGGCTIAGQGCNSTGQCVQKRCFGRKVDCSKIIINNVADEQACTSYGCYVDYSVTPYVCSDDGDTAVCSTLSETNCTYLGGNIGCSWGAICTPDCVGRPCGSDGCGGSCGTCPPNDSCIESDSFSSCAGLI